jgi:hypothetical protein
MHQGYQPASSDDGLVQALMPCDLQKQHAASFSQLDFFAGDRCGHKIDATRPNNLFAISLRVQGALFSRAVNQKLQATCHNIRVLRGVKWGHGS